jgi:soluble lytic murein transglycosylase-like protein
MKQVIRREACIFWFMTIVSLCVWIRQAIPAQARSNNRLSAASVKEETQNPPFVALPVDDDDAYARLTSELLVDALVQIESAGDFLRVGKAGERGLMQIKSSTWKELTRRLYGKALPFDWAFDPEFNRKIGKAYLAELHAFLLENRVSWRSDERSLLLAAYNAGPNRVIQGHFDLKNMPASTQDYVERATALHEFYLADQAMKVRRLLAAGQEDSMQGPQG